MLDEIDKLGADFRGDPASALLEVLDPEQNHTFRDHYLDVPFDLSEVLFITTANVLDPVPPALRDRMEVLELPGYTEEEKLEIAREHLVAKQVPNHGLTAESHRASPTTRSAPSSAATRARPACATSSARSRALCRKVARRRAEGRRGAGRRSRRTVVIEMLGAPQFLDEEVAERTKDPGVAIGLAWTPAGGEVLFIEASRMPGAGTLTLTGQLGDVMKESARAALSWVRANAGEYGIDRDFFKNAEIHIHVPSGAIPKDGPSAGVAMVTALASRADRPARARRRRDDRRDHAARPGAAGRAASRRRCSPRGARASAKSILPRQNEKNVKEDLSEELRRDMTIHLVTTIDEVLLLALLAGARLAARRPDGRTAPRQRSRRVAGRRPACIIVYSTATTSTSAPTSSRAKYRRYSSARWSRAIWPRPRHRRAGAGHLGRPRAGARRRSTSTSRARAASSRELAHLELPGPRARSRASA